MDTVLTGPHTVAAIGAAIALFLLAVIAVGTWKA